MNEDGQTFGNNSASVIVIPDPENAYFNFKIKWAATGTKAIIYTNGQAWANPADGSVIVTASGNSMRGNSLSAMR